MNEELRNQVNTARRAGYSDADIVQYLGQQDPRFGKAVESGYDPSEILGFIAPTPTAGETASRYAGVIGRAAAPVAAGTTGGALMGAPLGPAGAGIGAVVGGLSVPVADALVSAYNSLFPDSKVQMPSEAIRTALEKIGAGGTKPETRGERMAASAAEALTGGVSGVAGGGAAKLAASPAVRSIGTEVSRAPISQIVGSAPIGAGTQFVGEVTNNPLIAAAAGAGAGAATGMRPRIRGEGPSRADIQTQIAERYKILNESGVLIDDTGFRTSMAGDVLKDLRKEGYSPTNPKMAGITSLVDDLISNKQPKDIVELQAIRKQITASASPNEPEAYRMMKIVRDRFDDYIANVPQNQVLAGDKNALKAWEQARGLFQKDRKAEIFQDILDKAPVSKGQFAQSGMENYLYNEVKKLARDDNRMRLFNASEQTAIKEAAAGTSAQNLIKLVGKLSPTGYWPLMSILGVGYFAPDIASGMAGVGLAARYGAEQMRLGSIERLIDQILSGQKPPSPTVNVPATTMRGLLSTPTE